MTAPPVTTADVLREAKALVADPARWIKGEDAVDADGEECDIFDREAACFCAGGAIVRAAATTERWDPALRAFRLATVGDDQKPVVFYWNDVEARTHDEVMAAFDRAIALAEAA